MRGKTAEDHRLLELLDPVAEAAGYEIVRLRLMGGESARRLQIIDPAEQDFPFEDPTLFKGLEHLPEQMTDPRALQKAYRREFEAFLRVIRSGCRDLQMEHVLLRTDRPLDAALTSFLTARMARAGRT